MKRIVNRIRAKILFCERKNGDFKFDVFDFGTNTEGMIDPFESFRFVCKI